MDGTGTNIGGEEWVTKPVLVKNISLTVDITNVIIREDFVIVLTKFNNHVFWTHVKKINLSARKLIKLLFLKWEKFGMVKV